MTSAVEKGAIPVPLASRLVGIPPARIRAWLACNYPHLSLSDQCFAGFLQKGVLLC